MLAKLGFQELADGCHDSLNDSQMGFFAVFQLVQVGKINWLAENDSTFLAKSREFPVIQAAQGCWDDLGACFVNRFSDPSVTGTQLSIFVSRSLGKQHDFFCLKKVVQSFSRPEISSTPDRKSSPGLK